MRQVELLLEAGQLQEGWQLERQLEEWRVEVEKRPGGWQQGESQLGE
jgi:hypothetical protein